jgi:hypothetical protein
MIILLAQVKAIPLKNTIWRKNVISVCWDNPTEENKDLRALVRKAITDTWEANSTLKFIDWAPASE